MTRSALVAVAMIVGFAVVSAVAGNPRDVEWWGVMAVFVVIIVAVTAWRSKRSPPNDLNGAPPASR